MERHARVWATAALTAILLGFAAADPSVATAYCASINTGDTSANSSIYQSDGLCYDFCNDQSYAFAVLQEKLCWCSNYVPDSSVQVATSECETPCPGYPTDYCGGDSLYGYLALDAAPSGTTGATTSATSTSKSKTSDSVTTSSSATAALTSTSSTPLTSDKSSLTSTTPTSTASTSEPTTSSTEPAKTTSQKDSGGTPTTITSVRTVTSEGSIIIQTITTISTPSADSGNNGLAKGAIAGLVVGILAALGAFILGAVLFRRHKKRMQSEAAMSNGGMGDRQGSSAGIMSKAGTVSSAGYGLAMEEDGSYGNPGRRMSMKPMDPRLDPKVGLYRIASHDSLNTIRDDQDYSRRVHETPRIMRVTNPDPDD